MATKKATANGAVSVTFDYERDTKNKVRFAERENGRGGVVVGTLYVDKSAVQALGNPSTLTVSITAG